MGTCANCEPGGERPNGVATKEAVVALSGQLSACQAASRDRHAAIVERLNEHGAQIGRLSVQLAKSDEVSARRHIELLQSFGSLGQQVASHEGHAAGRREAFGDIFRAGSVATRILRVVAALGTALLVGGGGAALAKALGLL